MTRTLHNVRIVLLFFVFLFFLFCSWHLQWHKSPSYQTCDLKCIIYNEWRSCFGGLWPKLCWMRLTLGWIKTCVLQCRCETGAGGCKPGCLSFFVRSDMRSGVITKRQAFLSAARQIETTSICPVLQASSSLSLCVSVKPRVEACWALNPSAVLPLMIMMF